jgi:hypothetical protein
MFYDDLRVRDGDQEHALIMSVGLSERTHMVFQFWAAELARDVLRLGVYFHAMGFFLQAPGAADYDWKKDREFQMEHGTEITELADASSKHTLRNVLAECLRLLGAPSLITQIPATKYAPEGVPEEWKPVIARCQKTRNRLLGLVADCVDRLLVDPGLEEIRRADQPHWWHRFPVDVGPAEDDCPSDP